MRYSLKCSCDLYSMVKVGHVVKVVLEGMVKTHETPFPSIAGDIFAALVHFIFVYEMSRAALPS